MAKLFAFFGHHKGGTRWIGKIIRQMSKHLGLKYFTANIPKEFGFDLEEYISKHQIEFLNYLNSDIAYIKQIRNDFKGFHVVRDPRDIAVSAYFSHLYTHPTEGWTELAEHRKILATLSKDEGLLVDIQFTSRLRTDGCDLNLFSSMENWMYGMPNVMEVKFENLISNTYNCCREIFHFLGLSEDKPESDYSAKISQDESDAILFKIVEENNFSNLAHGRSAGTEDINSHYRKGIIGDWKNHFTQEHKNYFKGNYNDLLIKLGYESDDRW
ncbi:sulfotransferase domain-containing protein [Microcoleus sp. herbarium8]|uniref:sulfotransferase domain-containing protein n=1 Tax=Microcoleus sp. herbarium8 TaxID=3055436 RepID=UPI002FD176BA